MIFHNIRPTISSVDSHTGSLEVKLPTFGQMQQQLWEQSGKRKSHKIKIIKSIEKKNKVREKKSKVREKVEQSRNLVLFQCFVALEGRKVGSPKRRVRRHLAGWEIEHFRPLWPEAHFHVEMTKAPQRRSTYGNCVAEKVRGLCREAHFEVKMVKAPQARKKNWKLRCWKNGSKFPGSAAFWSIRSSGLLNNLAW